MANNNSDLFSLSPDSCIPLFLNWIWDSYSFLWQSWSRYKWKKISMSVISTIVEICRGANRTSGTKVRRVGGGITDKWLCSWYVKPRFLTFPSKNRWTKGEENQIEGIPCINTRFELILGMIRIPVWLSDRIYKGDLRICLDR